MAHFDGRIDSIGPSIRDTGERLIKIESEIFALHSLLNRLGVQSYGANGELNLAERIEELLKKQPDWEKVK